MNPTRSISRPRPDPSFESAIQRIRTEYTELPGLQLTPWQASRLWHLEQPVCDAALGALVESAFLQRTRQGAYVRALCR